MWTECDSCEQNAIPVWMEYDACVSRTWYLWEQSVLPLGTECATCGSRVRYLWEQSALPVGTECATCGSRVRYLWEQSALPVGTECTACVNRVWYLCEQNAIPVWCQGYIGVVICHYYYLLLFVIDCYIKLPYMYLYIIYICNMYNIYWIITCVTYCFCPQLGGKNAAIVFSDADVTKAVATCLR